MKGLIKSFQANIKNNSTTSSNTKAAPKKRGRKKKSALIAQKAAASIASSLQSDIVASIKKDAPQEKNCLTCSHFVSCGNKNRGFTFVCDLYSGINASATDDLLSELTSTIAEKPIRKKSKKKTDDDFLDGDDFEDEDKPRGKSNANSKTTSKLTKTGKTEKTSKGLGRQNTKSTEGEKTNSAKDRRLDGKKPTSRIDNNAKLSKSLQNLSRKIKIASTPEPEPKLIKPKIPKLIQLTKPKLVTPSGVELVKESASSIIIEPIKSKSIWDNIFRTEDGGSVQEKKEMKFDLESSIDGMLDNTGGPLPKDLRIDDGDFPLAKNFYEFAISPDYINYRLYFKQMEVSIKYLSEYCPYCTDMNWWMSEQAVDTDLEEILNNVQLLEHGICPKCKTAKCDLVAEESLYDYEVMAGLVGQRGGKSAVSAILANYLLHNYLKIQNPPQTMELLPNSQLIGTMVALTYKQIVESIWEPFKEALSSSPWFTGYNEMLSYYANKYGEADLFAIKEMFIRYKHRQLLIYPSGPNKRTLRGRTRFLSIIDEIGWFDANNTKLVKTNAEEVYTALGRSMRTVRSAVHKLRKKGVNHIIMPMSLNVSSPAERGDMSMKLNTQSIGSKTIYGYKYPTWEFNPTMPRESLEDEFKLNPISAKRDYGAEPPNSASPYIYSLKDFNGVYKTEVGNAFNLIQTIITTKNGKKFTSGKVEVEVSNANPRVLSLDGGLVNNSFAITLARNSVTGRPVIDAMTELMPTQDRPISHHHVINSIVFPLIEEYNVKLVVSDRWQSLKTMQDIEANFPDVVTSTMSLKGSHFVTFRELIYSGGVLFPLPELEDDAILELIDKFDEYPNCFKGFPISHFLGQCLFSHFDSSGTKAISKGSGRTDDILYSAALAVSYLLDPDWAEVLKGLEELPPKRPESLGVVNRRIASISSKSTSFSTKGNSGGFARLQGIAAMRRSTPACLNNMQKRQKL